MRRTISRREALAAGAAVAGVTLAGPVFAEQALDGEGPLRLATFSADVTCPLGHPLMGGGIPPAKQIDDPLFARGLVFLGRGDPIVLVSVEWCEIRNDAFERWRTVLAEAAGTRADRVLVSSVHVHDAPIADLTAQKLLAEQKAAGAICDLEFHERAVQQVAKVLRDSLAAAQTVTHFSLGQAKVEQIASNRRYLLDDGAPAYNRMSATRDAAIRDKPEGTIDPWLKTIGFWNGDRAIAALNSYATHPMSHYGKGAVSADFVGQARRRRQSDDPRIFQIYASGCSGNVTAGKYNDGDPANRQALADRLYQAMRAAWEGAERQPVSQLAFRSVAMDLKPRTGPGFSEEELQAKLKDDPRPFGQCLAALALSRLHWLKAGRKIDVAAIDFGPAQILLLPAESYVEYQLLAQSMRPESFVLVMGYGECSPGYIPIERAFREHDSNLNDWCWVDPGCEAAMTAAIEAALKPGGR
jgi:hypothetical protein